MKFQSTSLLALAVAPISNAFTTPTFGVLSFRGDVSLAAKIRGPTDKAEELRFGKTKTHFFLNFANCNDFGHCNE